MVMHFKLKQNLNCLVRFKYAEVLVFTDRKFGKSKLDSSIIGEAFIRVILIKLQSFFKLNK